MTTMASADRFVTGGVDTHRDIHVAAALDQLGGVLGTAQFPTTKAGYRSVLAWLAGFGQVVGGAVVAHGGQDRMTRIRRSAGTNRTITASAGPAVG